MLWRKFTNAIVEKVLRMGRGAVIQVTNANGTVSTISLTELAKLDGLTATVPELNILAGVTATAAEINMAADNSANTEIVTATNVIAAAESGSTYFLNSATEFVSTLPLPALGLRFSFLVSAAPSGADYTIVTNGSANIIKGRVLSSDLNAASDGDLETSGGDTISFVSAKAVAGDRVDLISDGTNWFAEGSCSVFDAITITTAS